MNKTMLDVTREKLTQEKALQPGVNKYIQQVTDAISFPTVPSQMKNVVAVALLTNFAAQFRRNILLWDEDTEVPINAISFVIAGSGFGKDSSKEAARKCFRPGIELVQKELAKRVKLDAIKAATAAEEECPNEYAVYKDYLKPIPPIDITPSTGPGLIKHVNDIADLPLSSGFLYSGEFSTELATSGDMIDNIKILSELYDLGVKNATYTKGVEHRAKEIDGQPVSALFIGSPDPIFYDESTKKKFTVEFMSKLARRSWFCYAPKALPEPDFMSEDDPLAALEAYEEHIENQSRKAIAAMSEEVLDVAKYHLDLLGQPIEVTDDVFKLFKIYKRYNNDLADTYPNQRSTYVLIRRHLQWKALKLAGAFAIMDKSDSISKENYIDAIRFCESLDDDMNRFEADLNKSYHERFSDYIRTLLGSDNKAVVNTHDIKKHGFLSNPSKSKLQELVTLCAGYDPDGIYTVINEASAIQYEPIIKTDVIGVSYKPIDNTAVHAAVATGDKEEISRAKQAVAATTAYGFSVEETTFADLSVLLQGDFAYSPFKLNEGKRGREYIISSTKWLVFDIDESPLTYEETHFMLSDINHHIAPSSDPNNQYKFRLLIELDSAVDLSPIAWKTFCSSIATDLAIKIDPLPQSQIFFSYASEVVLSQLDAEPLAVRDYVMRALDAETNRSVVTAISSRQAKAMLEDKLNTFIYAYEAPNGQGSRSLIHAAYHAKDLGASKEDTLSLIEDINSYWHSPMDPERFSKILQQVERMF